MSYSLPQDSLKESDRLHIQNRMLRHVFHTGGGVLPNAVKLPDGPISVLEAAAGTCTWSSDLAELPEVKSRRGTPNEVKLFASDISDLQFPPKDTLERLGIEASVHDVTKPFPSEFMSKFDIVSMTHLVLGLDEANYRTALLNVRDILKPGGQLILLEADHDMIYTAEDLQKVESGISPADLRFASTFAPINRILEEDHQRNGHLLNLASRLPHLAQDASFVIDSYIPYTYPTGKQCRTTLGPFGQSMTDQETPTLQNRKVVLEALIKNAYHAGFLMSRDGNHKIESEDERKKLEEEVIGDLEREGAFHRLAQAVVRRL